MSLRNTRLLLMSVLVVLALVTTAVFPIAASAERTIALSAGSFAFDVDPGQEMTGEVTVINPSEEPIRVMVYTAYQVIDEEGEVTYVTPNRDDPDFAARPTAWVRLSMPADAKAIGNTPYLEMEPGERIPVEFVFQPPMGVAPGDHNVVLFFEMFDLAAGAEGAVTQVRGRLGSRIQMRVSGEHVKRMSVRPLVVPTVVFGGEVPFDMTLRNTGNLDQRVSVASVLFDRNEREVAREEPLTASVVFAGNNRRLEGRVLSDGQPIGPHTLQAEVYEVDEDGNILELTEPVVESRVVWMIPWWVLIAAGATVLILLGRVVWHFAGKKKVEKVDPRTEARLKRMEQREEQVKTGARGPE